MEDKYLVSINTKIAIKFKDIEQEFNIAEAKNLCTILNRAINEAMRFTSLKSDVNVYPNFDSESHTKDQENIKDIINKQRKRSPDQQFYDQVYTIRGGCKK